MVPIINEFKSRGLEKNLLIVNSAQHQELLDPFWKMFNVQPHFSLDVMRHDQSLGELTARILINFQEYLDTVRDQIFAIMAQGDTTTVLSTSLIAFYNKIPFYHLEGGLRSFDLHNPFPEEMNRKVASITASQHFVPTFNSRNNLLKEGIADDQILVSGNTIVDCLEVVKKLISPEDPFDDENLNRRIDKSKTLVFITCHRRENQGKNLTTILQAITELAEENKHMQFLWILHPNPNIRKPVLDSSLQSMENIIIAEPLSYLDMVRVLAQSMLAISDSGGIQEEAPSFNVPVIVLREATERPEGVEIGASKLVGANPDKLKKAFRDFVDTGIKIESNPYGDGLAASRIVNKIIELAG
jgi:UDP-N-acetylglucosamine 2-epimerase